VTILAQRLRTCMLHLRSFLVPKGSFATWRQSSSARISLLSSNQAIQGASLFIALIGPHWLTVKEGGRRRLDKALDHVRREIEWALEDKVNVVVVLVDGAKMPKARELPQKIKALATINALELPWHEGIVKLEDTIREVEKKRAAEEAAELAERERLDLTRGEGFTKLGSRSQRTSDSFNTVIEAMELSLARQGHKVSLDPNDLSESMEKLTGRSLDQGFVMSDLIYVIDIIGVKTKRGDNRYVARSYPLKSLAGLPEQLRLRRPVLAGVRVFQSWFRKPTSKTGIIDAAKPGYSQGAIFGVIVGWDPGKQELKLVTPWRNWGDGGIAYLNSEAAKQSLVDSNLRAIEAVLMPEPFTRIATPPDKGPPRKARKTRRTRNGIG
jgi:hypothetical protein